MSQPENSKRPNLHSCGSRRTGHLRAGCIFRGSRRSREPESRSRKLRVDKMIPAISTIQSLVRGKLLIFGAALTIHLQPQCPQTRPHRPPPRHPHRNPAGLRRHPARLPGPPPALRSHGNRSPPPARRRSLAPRSRPPGSDRDPRRPNLQTQRINRPHPRPSSSASRTAAQAPNRLLTPHPFPQNEPNSVPELTPRSPQPPRNSHATPEPTTHNPQPERPQAAPTPPVAQNEPNSVPPPPPEQTAGPPQPPFPPLHLHTHRDPGALGLL